MAHVDLERLDQAIARIARLIASTGEDYWPLLDRLEAERDMLISRRERLTRYVREPANPVSACAVTDEHAPDRHASGES